jgi:hypothetical protein
MDIKWLQHRRIYADTKIVGIMWTRYMRIKKSCTKYLRHQYKNLVQGTISTGTFFNITLKCGASHIISLYHLMIPGLGNYSYLLPE